MKRFLLKTGLFLCLLIAIFYVLSYMVDNGLKKYTSYTFTKWRNIVNGEINAEVLVLGNSRAMVQYDPAILEAKLNMSCYVLGFDGTEINMLMAIYKTYLLHNTPPKYLILNVDMGTLGDKEDLYEKIQYLPYIDEGPLYQGMRKIDPLVWQDRYFPLYKYRSFYPMVFRGLLSFFNLSSVECELNNNGFIRRDLVWDGSFDKMKIELNGKILYKPFRIIQSYRTIAELNDLCKKSGTQLILVYAPQYIGLSEMMPQMDSLVKHAQSFQNPLGYWFYNFTNDSLCDNKLYFYNSMHLNALGSKLFSNQMADSLKISVNNY